MSRNALPTYSKLIDSHAQKQNYITFRYLESVCFKLSQFLNSNFDLASNSYLKFPAQPNVENQIAELHVFLKKLGQAKGAKIQIFVRM